MTEEKRKQIAAEVVKYMRELQTQGATMNEALGLAASFQGKLLADAEDEPWKTP